MKFATIILLVLFAFVNAKPDYPDCAEDPVNNNPLCNILPPECRIPICGRDYNYNKAMWFGNGCYMVQYNKICNTDFQKTADAFCDKKLRPLPPLKPCRP